MLSATIVTFGAMVGVIGSIGLVRHLGRARGTDDSCTALTDPTFSKQYSQLKADLVDRIATGHFAADHSGIMLAEGERLLIRIPLVSYCAHRAPRRNAVTFRIAPALRNRTRGTGPAEGDKITELDCGDFAITSRRIIFISGAKSVDFLLSKIIQIEAMEDQIALTRRGKKKAEYFVGVDKFTASAAMEQRVSAGVSFRAGFGVRFRVNFQGMICLLVWFGLPFSGCLYQLGGIRPVTRPCPYR